MLLVNSIFLTNHSSVHSLCLWVFFSPW